MSTRYAVGSAGTASGGLALRHVTLSMLALAFLAAVRAEASETTRRTGSGKKGLLVWERSGMS